MGCLLTLDLGRQRGHKEDPMASGLFHSIDCQTRTYRSALVGCLEDFGILALGSWRPWETRLRPVWRDRRPGPE